MVATSEVHSLGASIVGMGWDDEKCSDATCIEMSPRNKAAHMAANHRLVQMRDGRLAAFQDQEFWVYKANVPARQPPVQSRS